jgi:DNA-binding NarL/FixJ family response regulator
MASVAEVCAAGEPWLPPLFSNEEWREIVAALSLSPRQAQIVGLLIQGRKDKEIGAALAISKSTVRTHLIETKARMAAEDRVELAYRVFWTFRCCVEPKRYAWTYRDSASKPTS